MPVGMRLMTNNIALKRAISRMNRSPEIMGMHLANLVHRAQIAARAEARGQLTDLVYSAPLPDTASADYLATRRTGATWYGISMDPVVEAMHVAYGDVRIPHSVLSDNGVYYPWVLEHGSNTVGRGRNGTYLPREYWRNTARVMRERFKGMGRIELKGIRGSFAGQSAGEAATLSVRE